MPAAPNVTAVLWIIMPIITAHAVGKPSATISGAAIAAGGIDHAFGNKHDDIIFGGIAGDFVKGDDGADGDDVILTGV